MKKAMIFAAGKGTRLGEMTTHIPKALVPVAGKPMLYYVCERLKRAGVRSVVVNLHHLKDQIERYFAQHQDAELEVQFSVENELLDTGGGLFHARSSLEAKGSFFIHNCDIYTSLDLKKLEALHIKENPIATLAVMDRDTPRRLIFNDRGELVGWENRSTDSRRVISQGVEKECLAFGGIHAVSSRIFEYMQNEPTPFSIMTTYLKAAEAGERILAYRMDGEYWIDVGKPEQLKELELKLKATP